MQDDVWQTSKAAILSRIARIAWFQTFIEKSPQ